MSRLRVGFVGCGGRGRNHMEQLHAFEDVEMVAVCDLSSAARDRAVEEFGVARGYASVEEMLDAETLDAAFVSPTAHLNARLALPFLKQGVDTLMEKPPGMSAAETRELRDAAAQSGARAMVGWNRRFNPSIVEARRMVEEQGPVVQLVGEFHKSMARMIENERLPEVVMEKSLLETPIHTIDILRAIAGSDVAEVHGFVRRVFSKYDDIYAAQIVFENGCLANFAANYTSDARLERYEIHGRWISAYLEGVRGGVVFRDGERLELSGNDNGTPDQDRYFIDCIKEDRPISLPAANLDEAVKTMELADNILAGMRL